MDISGTRRSSLGEVAADKQGKFSFGEVPVGRYVLVTAGGTTDVEVTAPSNGESDTVMIKPFGMGCKSASAVLANGMFEL
jgi:hypothetical protein